MNSENPMHEGHSLRVVFLAGEKYVFCDTCDHAVIRLQDAFTAVMGAAPVIEGALREDERERASSYAGVLTGDRKQLETFFRGAATVLVDDAIADNFPGGREANIERVKSALLRACDLGAGKVDK